MLFLVRLQETNVLVCRRDGSDGEMLSHPLPERSAARGFVGLQELKEISRFAPVEGKKAKSPLRQWAFVKL
jgi:hypothetical protein